MNESTELTERKALSIRKDKDNPWKKIPAIKKREIHYTRRDFIILKFVIIIKVRKQGKHSNQNGIRQDIRLEKERRAGWEKDKGKERWRKKKTGVN